MTSSGLQPGRASSRRQRGLIGAAAIALTAGLVAGFRVLMPEESSQVASFPVGQGEFRITLALSNGELEAVNAEQINAPQVRGQLKITKLFPEGETVEIGDLVIEFDKAEFVKRVTEARQALEASRAEIEKTMANQKVEIGRQQSDIHNKEAELRLAQLKLKKMEFESLIDKEETRLKVRQSELALEQAHRKFEAQRIVDQAEKRKQELDVAQKERGLEKAEKDLGSLSVHADKPGLVVYEKIWKGSRPEKIRVGDEPWSGATLVTLPDLTAMQVKTWVNEVDVDKLEVGQQAAIELDALPGPTFRGSITSVASLGHEKEGDKNVKVFDVVIGIDGEDERLKPGMSASSVVVIETVPEPPGDVDSLEVSPPPGEEEGDAALPLYIPLDAVFEKGGETLVYRVRGGGTEERKVVLGKRNDDYVIVEEGLAPGDRVALRDPTLVLEHLGGMPGEAADPASALNAE